ncbi:MAG: hypothetical protein WAX80_01675 [Minisyncoccia bacterium]
MDLDRELWYVRWFFWSLDIWDDFNDNNTQWKYRNGTNLCHFMRVIFVWCPLVLLLHLVLYASAIVVVTALPIYLYGGTSYAWVIGTIVATCVSIIVAKRFLKWVEVEEVPHRIKQIYVGLATRIVNSSPSKPVKTEPSFLKVILEYIVAAKKKICPTITFTRKLEEN